VDAPDGIQVLNPKGTLIGKILFMGSSNTLWAIKLNTRGLITVRVRNSPGCWGSGLQDSTDDRPVTFPTDCLR